MNQKPARKRSLRRLVSAPLVLALLPSCLACARAESRATSAQLDSARAYIRRSLHTLARSSRDLAAAAPDPKFKRAEASRRPVYVPRGKNLKAML